MRRAPSSSPLAAAAALILASALALLVIAGCCALGKDPRQRDPDPSPSPVTSGSGRDPGPARQVGIDLGVAAFPDGTKTDRAALHTWAAKSVRPPSYKLGYALGPTEEQALKDAFRKYARAVRFKPGDGGRFSWIPPKGCAGDLRCVFDELAEKSQASVAPIAAIFKRRARDAKLNSVELASLIVGFVQFIRYEIPKEEPFGLLPPSLVVSQKRGDCDSKALLGHMLLRDMGISSVVISSVAHRHAMLGIALPTPGTTFTVEGTRYAYTECTAKGSPIGHINPELLRPNDWRIVPVRLGPR
jgi:hypothetical protein